MLTSERAQIVLSGRYKSDDHLWFTFGHESGHLVKHDVHGMYVDELDRRHTEAESPEEREADAFSANFLVPPDVRADFPRRPTPTQVHGLAGRAGVAPGIIVGQMQHAGILGFDSRLNHLKRRYKWVDSILERA